MKGLGAAIARLALASLFCMAVSACGGGSEPQPESKPLGDLAELTGHEFVARFNRNGGRSLEPEFDKDGYMGADLGNDMRMSILTSTKFGHVTGVSFNSVDQIGHSEDARVMALAVLQAGIPNSDQRRSEELLERLLAKSELTDYVATEQISSTKVSVSDRMGGMIMVEAL